MSYFKTFTYPVKFGNVEEIYLDIRDITPDKKVESHPKIQMLVKEILKMFEGLLKERVFQNYFTEYSTLNPGMRTGIVIVTIENLGETNAATANVFGRGVEITLNEKICLMFFDGEYPKLPRVLVHETMHFLHRKANPAIEKRIDAIRVWAAKRAKTERAKAEIMAEKIIIPRFDTSYETIVKFFTYLLYHFVSEGIAFYAGELERHILPEHNGYAQEGVNTLRSLRETYVKYEKTAYAGYVKAGQRLFDELIGYSYWIGAHMVDVIISSGLADLEDLIKINENQFVQLYEKACAKKGIKPLISLWRRNEETSFFDMDYTFRRLKLARDKKI